MVNAKLTDTLSDRCGITGVAKCQSIQYGGNERDSPGISEIGESLVKDCRLLQLNHPMNVVYILRSGQLKIP